MTSHNELRMQWLSSGWGRGAFICLKENAHLLDLLPVEIRDKVSSCEDVYLIPLLYDCALIDGNFETEPWVPVLVCWKIENSIGNFEKGKNPRVYHFPLEVEGDTYWFEGSALGLWVVSRMLLLKSTLADGICWPASTLDRLLSWVGARVTRSVFPDEWNELIEVKRKRFEQIWKSNNFRFVSSVYLNLSKEESVFNAKVILAVPDDDVNKSFWSPGGGSREIEEKLSSVMNAIDGIKSTVLVMPENQITLKILRNFKLWPLDYYSFRSSPVGASPPSAY